MCRNNFFGVLLGFMVGERRKEREEEESNLLR